MSDRESFFVLEAPLAPALGAFQTRSVHLLGFPALVHNLGYNPIRILDRHGIDKNAILDVDSYVNCHALVDMIGQCSAELNQPLFGVMLARQQATHFLGPLGTLCRAAPDFRTAIDNLCEYTPLVQSPQCKLENAIGDLTSELRLSSRSDFEFLDQMMYGGTLTTMLFLTELGGGDFVPKYATTRYRPAQPVLDDLEKELGCKVYPGQEHDAIGFSSGILSKPLPSANRLIFTLLKEYFIRVQREQRNSLLDRVEDYIRNALSGQCTLRRCATALGTNTRSLQIRLAEIGVSFSDLVNRQKSEIAKEYVRSGEFTLDEIAAKLGYAEQTSFGRAFRRWTGSTPGKFNTR